MVIKIKIQGSYYLKNLHTIHFWVLYLGRYRMTFRVLDVSFLKMFGFTTCWFSFTVFISAHFWTEKLITLRNLDTYSLIFKMKNNFVVNL